MTITIHYCQWCAAVYDGATITECENCHQIVTHFSLDVPGVNLAEQSRIETNYRGAIRSMVRGLWTGNLDLDQAFDSGDTAIRFGLTQAWNAGLQSVGVQPSEQSPAERIELQRIINNEASRLFAFLVDVEAGSKANGGALKPQMARADLWINRARDVKNQARAIAQTDPKLKWVVGPTEESCTTCNDKLNGKVKRASTWRRRNLHPQGGPNPQLICRGWNCLCVFEPTDEPLSRGPLPKTP
jgi:hypothetical protein